MSDEQEHKRNLQEARLGDSSAAPNSANSVPDKPKTKRPLVDLSSDSPFIFAISLAALKDLLDWAVIGSFPGIGTVVTIIFTIAIVVLLFFAAPEAIAGNSIMLISGAGVESFIFGLNFLPILTGTVVAIYIRHALKRKGIAIVPAKVLP